MKEFKGRIVTPGTVTAEAVVTKNVFNTLASMPVIDCLGDEFLDYVKDGMKITIKDDGTVCVD